jgi:hypothetical protein
VALHHGKVNSEAVLTEPQKTVYNRFCLALLGFITLAFWDGDIFKIMVLGQNSYLDFLPFDRFNCGKALVAQFSQIAMHI